MSALGVIRTRAPRTAPGWLTLSAAMRLTGMSTYTFLKTVGMGRVRVLAPAGSACQYNQADVETLAAERKAQREVNPP